MAELARSYAPFLALPFLFLLAGYFVYGWRQPRGEKPLSLAEGVFLMVSASVLLASWLALVLAELGLYSLGGLALLLVLLSAGLWWGAGRRAPALPRLGGGPEALGLLGVLLLAGLLYGRPAEFILGGLDPGVYVNTGVNIARTGGIIIRDRELANLPAEGRAALFREKPRPFSYGSRHIGLYIRDIEQGIVAPHGFHLYPVWIAILYAIGGLGTALLATSLFALLGVAALYFLGRRLFESPAVGLLAASWLALNPAQVWFARYPAAEMLAQFQLWSGLYFFVSMLEGRGRLFALLAALALGEIYLTKIEMFFLPLMLGGFLAYEGLAGRFRRQYWYFIAPHGLLLLHGALHAALISPWYSYSVFRIPAVPLATVGAVVAAGGVFLLAIYFARRRVGGWIGWLESRWAPFAALLIILVGLLALYAYFIRPLGSEAAGAYEANNRQSLVRLGWYISPLGVLLGVVGFQWALARPSRWAAPVLIVAAAEALIYLIDAKITPVHFWAARRFVPVVIPAFLLCAAYFAWRLWPRGRVWWPRALVPAVAVAALSLWSVAAAWPFLGHREYAGATADLAAMSRLFPPGAVALYEWSEPAWRVALPLEYIWGVTGFLVPPEALDDPRFGALVRWFQGQGRGVYWVSTGGDADLPPPGQALEPVGGEVFGWPEAERAADHRPERILELAAALDVYRFRPAPTADRRRVALMVDVGGEDQPYVATGFYPPTAVTGCAACRWTDGDAALKLPWPEGAKRAQLVLALAGGRPAGQPLAEAEVWANGRSLWRQRVANFFRTYYLPLEEAPSDAVLEVRLRSDTWPGSGESLGMLLDWLRLEALE